MPPWPARPSAALLVTALLFLRAGIAYAAPPDNDLSSFATPASKGFSEVLDTTEATTDADDEQLNAWCGLSATDASVWYTLTTTADERVFIDPSNSDYSAGLLIGVGEPGSLEVVACGYGAIDLFAFAGVTYHVIVVDTQQDGGGNGGELEISFTEPPPPPTIDITVDPVGHFDAQTGVATVSGTYTCTRGYFLSTFGNARQSVGRVSTIQGDFSFDAYEPDTCDGQPHGWSAEVPSYVGKFAGGEAFGWIFAHSCGPFGCSEQLLEYTVQLRGGSGR